MNKPPMNKLWYEHRPLIYIGLAVICFLVGRGNKLAVISGVILLCTGLYVHSIRAEYRKRVGDQIRRMRRK